MSNRPFIHTEATVTHEIALRTLSQTGKRSVVVTEQNRSLPHDTLQSLARQGVICARVSDKDDAREVVGKIAELEEDDKPKCVFVDDRMKTRKSQKDFNLRRLRLNRKPMGIALIEQTTQLASLNKSYDDTVDYVFLHHAHGAFEIQLSYLKRRFVMHEEAEKRIELCMRNFALANSRQSFDANYEHDWLIFDTKAQCAWCACLLQNKQQEDQVDNADDDGDDDSSSSSSDDAERDEQALIARNCQIIDDYIEQKKKMQKRDEEKPRKGWFWWLPSW